MVALGNEIPATVVRWHGQARVEQFLRELHDEAKSAAPDTLFTYVNFPPTEYLELPFLDVCSFNVYLHDETKLRRYLARLQHVAGNLPLLISEAGADSIREGLDGQAELTAMQVRAAFAEGACGAVAYAWTDEWWRGGQDGRGLGVRPGRSPAAAQAGGHRGGAGVRRRALRRRPSARRGRRCRWWSAPTTPPTRSTTASRSLSLLNYPDYEVILVNDGSKDDTEDDRPAVSAGADHQHAEPRPEHGPQHRPGGRHRRDRRLHRRRRARRPRLADLPGAAVPQLGRGRGGRAQRRPRRRPVGGAVRRPRPGRPDPRAVRRSHRRARPGLQHGDAARGAQRHRRLQPDLPARRRRRGRVLAAAGRRRHHRLRARRRWSGTTTAPRSAPSGASRSATGRARCGCSRITPTSSSARGSSGAATSTARCPSSARCSTPTSTPASGAARPSRRSTASARPRWACCRTPRRGRSPRWCCW